MAKKARTLWFGESWNAPVNVPKDRLMSVPNSYSCTECEKRFEEGDQGVFIQASDDWIAYHKECLLDEILKGKVKEGELLGNG